MINFCPRCNKILMPIKGEDYTYVECSCGFKERIYSETISEKVSNEQVGEGVGEGNLFASYDHICKKCGHDKAEVIDMGIFISDEDNLILIRCGKCGHTERFGRKTS